ncbi:hypothetical protein DASC09_027240 [Saccharomycopsis crataegensis]|uniref:Uncharacterized protein n=1 Tax=Saccharomycopsis crataegensis TaxID=43959 RepID=A0AAV5QLT2_9ASCO|nr:hypothetical protein DASC09_027240 [Saccharomycopsis crataegensis]
MSLPHPSSLSTSTSTSSFRISYGWTVATQLQESLRNFTYYLVVIVEIKKFDATERNKTTSNSIH